jgi:drug/metabolite transporter (DMT)-like permease
MTRALVQLNVWVLGALLVVGIPLLTVAVQAAVRRVAPGIVEGEHNDVAGFLIAVVGVVYAVILAFIVVVTWEDFRDARTTVHREAGALRSLYRDTGALPEPARTAMADLVVRYGREVSIGEWAAMDRGESSRAVLDLVGQMFSTLGDARPTTPTQEAFLADALTRLNDVAEDRAERISVAEEETVSILWAAIVIGGILTVGFALLFGVSNERLHYVMVGFLAAVLALQVLVILVLSHPFTGDVRVGPEPFEHVVRDFSR